MLNRIAPKTNMLGGFAQKEKKMSYDNHLCDIPCAAKLIRCAATLLSEKEKK